MNVDELFDKAQTGTITKAEIAAVAALLTVEQDAVDPHRLLVILGHAGAVEYSGVVARYLERHDDPMLVRAALDVLCNDWGMTDAYLGTVKALARGEAWDAAQDARLMAISVTGEYLREQRDKDRELMGMLWGFFRNPAERQIVREAAYCALARAVDRAWCEIPSAARHFNLETEVDQTVLNEVRRLLEL